MLSHAHAENCDCFRQIEIFRVEFSEALSVGHLNSILLAGFCPECCHLTLSLVHWGGGRDIILRGLTLQSVDVVVKLILGYHWPFLGADVYHVHRSTGGHDDLLEGLLTDLTILSRFFFECGLECCANSIHLNLEFRGFSMSHAETVDQANWAKSGRGTRISDMIVVELKLVAPQRDSAFLLFQTSLTLVFQGRPLHNCQHLHRSNPWLARGSA
mmetsp:Transcript_42643/g.66789  ORF Transcript_42643/g.66789 Transcript_42643/m.66789 type:complete len:214 (+) Transcript_42643:2061-2702(+)